MAVKNGYIQLNLQEDGVYLKIYPPVDNGKRLTYDDVTRYLNHMKITNLDVSALNKINTINTYKEIKISNDRIKPVNEYMLVTLAPDKMAAYGIFFPPSNNGNLISGQDIINNLIKSGVKFGPVKGNIETFLRKRCYCTEILLAKGQAPIEGVDAFIEYQFSVDKTAKPKAYSDGSVDFHQLDIINHVNKGDLLAVLTPADPGRPGTDVTGKSIKQKKAVNKIIKFGKNIRATEDKREIYSEVSGHVVLVQDKVIVSNVFEVSGNVDNSTGDIDFDGNVTVKGNVITGFTVRAKGDIIVEGIVEGAKLYADGQIILQRGIQGMNRGLLDAKSNIVTKFIENTTVRAGGYLTSGSIMHSKVYAKGDVIVKGKKGFISGGEVKSGTMIAVKTAGSTMGTKTILEVGIDPGYMDEFHSLDKLISTQEKEKAKLEQIKILFNKKIKLGEKVKEDKLALLHTTINQLTQIEEDLVGLRERYDELKLEIDNMDSGKIIVDNVVYSGVRLVISNVVYYVRNECNFCEFVRDGADIKMMPHL